MSESVLRRALLAIALLGPGRLQPVVDAVRVAQRTRSIALQSIVVGLALSGVAMMAAALGQITPVAGILLQEGIDIAVIAHRTLGDAPTKHA